MGPTNGLALSVRTHLFLVQPVTGVVLVGPQALPRSRAATALGIFQDLEVPSLVTHISLHRIYRTRVLIAVRGRVLRCVYMCKHVCIIHASRLVHTYFLQDFEDCCLRDPPGSPLGAFLGRLGGLWNRLEDMLGVLERFEAVWGASWIVLGLEGRSQMDESFSQCGGAPPPGAPP